MRGEKRVVEMREIEEERDRPAYIESVFCQLTFMSHLTNI